jgi:hypothetical protein
MKKYLQLRRVLSLLMILILLIQQFSCTSSKVISINDFKVSPLYLYKIHYQKTTYILEEPVISNGVLSGKLVDAESFRNKKIIHIYPISDAVVTINSHSFLTLPLDKISQVKEQNISNGKTAALAVGGFVALIVIIMVVSYENIHFTL